MFESAFMEWFTHMHPATPVVLYVPPAAYGLWRAIASGNVSWAGFAALFLTGMLVWTLFEYLMHRYAFHYEPTSRTGRSLHFILHGVHHDYPNDATRLVLSPALSVPLVVISYFVLALATPRSWSPVIWAGFVIGYVCYDVIHYATHHVRMPTPIGRWLKQRHLRHHYQDDHANFGVSSPLWDIVFRTNRESR